MESGCQEAIFPLIRFLGKIAMSVPTDTSLHKPMAVRPNLSFFQVQEAQERAAWSPKDVKFTWDRECRRSICHGILIVIYEMTQHSRDADANPNSGASGSLSGSKASQACCVQSGDGS